MAIREVISADGTGIVYRVSGPEGARPLVLLHGWSGDLRCWGGAAEDLAARFRVLAVDLRGHGYSGAPATGYDDSALWAADVAAVLADAGIERDAVLVGWSYGGIVLTDYLAAHGTGAVAGAIYTGAMASIGKGVAGAEPGPVLREAMPGVFEESPGRAVRAFGAFGDANTGPSRERGVDAQRLFGASLATPPAVRKALFYRTVDNAATLRELDVPVLVLHGTDDPVVPVGNGRFIAETAPKARGSYWEGAKHGLFLEDRARWVAEVTEFACSL